MRIVDHRVSVLAGAQLAGHISVNTVDIRVAAPGDRTGTGFCDSEVQAVVVSRPDIQCLIGTITVWIILGNTHRELPRRIGM